MALSPHSLLINIFVPSFIGLIAKTVNDTVPPKTVTFLVACYAILHPAMLVRRLVSLLVGPLFTFSAFFELWAYGSCPDALVTFKQFTWNFVWKLTEAKSSKRGWIMTLSVWRDQPRGRGQPLVATPLMRGLGKKSQVIKISIFLTQDF